MLDERFAFRLTSEELELLRNKSKSANLKPSDFLRQLIVDSTVHIIPVADEICLTFAYVYDALNTGTAESTKKAIEVFAIFSKKLSINNPKNKNGLDAIFLRQCELCTTVLIVFCRVSCGFLIMRSFVPSFITK